MKRVPPAVRVGIVMGSESDRPVMEEATKVLADFGVGAWGARNAAFLALRILAVSDAALARRLEAHADALARAGTEA